MEEPALYIREREPEDLPLAVEIVNASNPPDAAQTVEQAEAWEAMLRPEEARSLRLLAFLGERGVANAFTLHGPFEVEGRFSVSIAVRPDYRRRGIAHALYGRLVAHARSAEARELACRVDVRNLPLVERWLAREGYREVERMRRSELALTDLDLTAHAEAEERAAAAGITFTTLAAEDTEESRRKLWALSTLTERDVPLDTVHPEEPFDRFVEKIDEPRCLRDCLVIACAGEEYVGFTVLGHDAPERAHTWMTGVHPAYRGRGIALALKLRCAQLARERGYRAMRTSNHLNNPAMLRVNERLGYRQLAETILFLKSL